MLLYERYRPGGPHQGKKSAAALLPKPLFGLIMRVGVGVVAVEGGRGVAWPRGWPSSFESIPLSCRPQTGYSAFLDVDLVFQVLVGVFGIFFSGAPGCLTLLWGDG